MDIRAWWATVHAVAEKRTQLRLSLCLSFCSQVRAQTGTEMQAGSGCLELPVRCRLQLENQWLWDRGSAPRVPAGPESCSRPSPHPHPHTGASRNHSRPCCLHWNPCFRPANGEYEPREPASRALTQRPRSTLLLPGWNHKGTEGRGPPWGWGLQGSQRPGTTESDHLMRLQGLGQTCLPCCGHVTDAPFFIPAYSSQSKIKGRG